MNDLIIFENGKPQHLNKDYVSAYKLIHKLRKESELADKEIIQQLKDYMEENGIETLSLDGLIFTYRKGSVRTSLDSKRLKEELPDIYEEFSKTSQVASSVVVKVLDD